MKKEIFGKIINWVLAIVICIALALSAIGGIFAIRNRVVDIKADHEWFIKYTELLAETYEMQSEYELDIKESETAWEYIDQMHEMEIKHLTEMYELKLSRFGIEYEDIEEIMSDYRLLALIEALYDSSVMPSDYETLANDLDIYDDIIDDYGTLTNFYDFADDFIEYLVMYYEQETNTTFSSDAFLEFVRQKDAEFYTILFEIVN